MNTGNNLRLQTVDAPPRENLRGGAGASLVQRNRALRHDPEAAAADRPLIEP
jgi:hypothetical protein